MMDSTFSFSILQISVLRLGIKAGTAFLDLWQVAVSEDHGIGVVELQRTEQCQQRLLLCLSTCVGIDALRVQSALVAHADRVGVVALGVCPLQVLMQRLVQVSVACHVVVVAGLSQPLLVVSNERLHGVAPVAARGAAVNDN